MHKHQQRGDSEEVAIDASADVSWPSTARSPGSQVPPPCRPTVTRQSPTGPHPPQWLTHTCKMDRSLV